VGRARLLRSASAYYLLMLITTIGTLRLEKLAHLFAELEIKPLTRLSSYGASRIERSGEWESVVVTASDSANP
jgi:hypothetical protein